MNTNEAYYWIIILFYFICFYLFSYSKWKSEPLSDITQHPIAILTSPVTIRTVDGP